MFKKTSKSSAVPQLAIQSSLMSCGVYEKLSKVTIGGKRQWKRNKRAIDDFQEEASDFADKEFPPLEEALASLAKQNSKLVSYMSWFRIHDYFKKQKYGLITSARISSQVIKNRGYVYIVDALNVLSTQPGLIYRLFERKRIVKEGVYAIWVNINGKWTNLIIDDYMPIFGDKNNKTKFFLSTPSLKTKEIWYLLLEKAMAKAYGGYINLFKGFENYAVRDLTGAPHLMHDIPHIPQQKVLKQREVDHINTMWEKLYKNFRKGYLISAAPRLPTQIEKLQNAELKIPSKGHYLSDGIYSGHNVAVVTIREVYDSNGNLARILKLRNPWMGEVWKGEWSKDSELWTEQLKKALNYDPERDGESEFWMSIRDFMSYYECLNVYKCIPGHTFNSIQIKVPPHEHTRIVVRISVPAKGKYTFSVDQNDLRTWADPNLSYSPINLTLGQVEHSTFKLLSHTSSQKLRNTFIRKLIEKGEYYLLIEKHNDPVKNQLIQQNPQHYAALNGISVSSYGPRTCGMTTIDEPRKNKVVFDYLCYFGWKGYSEQRIGEEIKQFKINFYDGSSNYLSLYLLNIPDSIIYAFKNDNDFGVELYSKFAGITNKEIVGPEGNINFEQEFSMNAGCSDVFILRDIENPQPGVEGLVNNTFQIKSVVGRKFIGEKENPVSFEQIKAYLLTEKASRKTCEIEKDKGISKKVGVFDLLNGFARIEMAKTEIKVKMKQYTSPMKLDQYEDIVDMDEVKKFQPMIEESAAAKAKIEAKKKEAQLKMKQIKEESGLSRREIDNKRSLSHHPRGMTEEDKKAMLESNRGISQDVKKVTQELKDIKPASPTAQNQQLQEPEPVVFTEEQKNRNLKILEAQIQTVDVIDDARLAKVLTLQKNQLLTIDNSDLKQLLRYFGIGAFITIYQVDDALLQKIVQKLLGVLEKEQLEQEAAKLSHQATQAPVSPAQETLGRRIIQNSAHRAEAASAQSRAHSQQPAPAQGQMDLLKPEAALQYGQQNRKRSPSQAQVQLEQMRQKELEEQLKLQAELEKQIEERKRLNNQTNNVQEKIRQEQLEQERLMKRKQELMRLHEERKLKEELEREKKEQEELQKRMESVNSAKLYKSQELGKQIAGANQQLGEAPSTLKQQAFDGHSQPKHQNNASTIFSKSQEFTPGGNVPPPEPSQSNQNIRRATTGDYSTPSKQQDAKNLNNSSPSGGGQGYREKADFETNYNSNASSRVSNAHHYGVSAHPNPKNYRSNQEHHLKVNNIKGFSASPQPNSGFRNNNLMNLENRIQDKLKAMKNLKDTYQKQTSAIAMNSNMSPAPPTTNGAGIKFSSKFQPESYASHKKPNKYTEATPSSNQIAQNLALTNKELMSSTTSNRALGEFQSPEIEVERESEHMKYLLRGSQFTNMSRKSNKSQSRNLQGNFYKKSSTIGGAQNNTNNANQAVSRDQNPQFLTPSAANKYNFNSNRKSNHPIMFKDKIARGSIPDANFLNRMNRYNKADLKRNSFNLRPSNGLTKKNTESFQNILDGGKLKRKESMELTPGLDRLQSPESKMDLQSRLRLKLDEAKRNNLGRGTLGGAGNELEHSSSRKYLENSAFKPQMGSGSRGQGGLENQIGDSSRDVRGANLDQYLASQGSRNNENGPLTGMKSSNYLRVSNAELAHQKQSSSFRDPKFNPQSLRNNVSHGSSMRATPLTKTNKKPKKNFHKNFNSQNTYMEKKRRRRNAGGGFQPKKYGERGGARSKADRILNKLQTNLRESQMIAQEVRQSLNETPLSQISHNNQNYLNANKLNLELFERFDKTIGGRKTATDGQHPLPPYKNKRARKTTNPEIFRRNQNGFDFYRSPPKPAVSNVSNNPPPPQQGGYPMIVDANHEVMNGNEVVGEKIEASTAGRNYQQMEPVDQLNRGLSRRNQNMARGVSQTIKDDVGHFQRGGLRGNNHKPRIGSIDHIRSMNKFQQQEYSRDIEPRGNHLLGSPPPPAPAQLSVNNNDMKGSMVNVLGAPGSTQRQPGSRIGDGAGRLANAHSMRNNIGSPHTPVPNLRSSALHNQNMASNLRNRSKTNILKNNKFNNRQASPATFSGYKPSEPGSVVTPRGKFLQLNNNLASKDQERGTAVNRRNNNILGGMQFGANDPSNHNNNFGRSSSIDNRHRYASNFNKMDNRTGFISPDPRVNNNMPNNNYGAGRGYHAGPPPPQHAANNSMHQQDFEMLNDSNHPSIQANSGVRAPGGIGIGSPGGGYSNGRDLGYAGGRGRRNGPEHGNNPGFYNDPLVKSPPPPAPPAPSKNQVNRLSMTSTMRDDYNRGIGGYDKKLAYGNRKKPKPKNKSFLSGLFS